MMLQIYEISPSSPSNWYLIPSLRRHIPLGATDQRYGSDWYNFPFCADTSHLVPQINVMGATDVSTDDESSFSSQNSHKSNKSNMKKNLLEQLGEANSLMIEEVKKSKRLQVRESYLYFSLSLKMQALKTKKIFPWNEGNADGHFYPPRESHWWGHWLTKLPSRGSNSG